MAEAVLTFRDLKQSKGWPYTRQHTFELIRKGRFPKPFKLEGGRTNLWLEREVDAFLAAKGAQG